MAAERRIIMENISAAVILDAVLVLALIASTVLGARRGLLKTVWKMGAWMIVIVCVMTLKTPFTSMLAQTSAAADLYNSVTEKITPVFTDNLYAGEVTNEQKADIAQTLHLPQIVVSQVLKDYDAQAVISGTTTAVNRAVDNIARAITMTIIGFVAAVVLFILVKLALFIVYEILNAFSKLPVINTANHTLGALWGFISMTLVIWIVCAIVSFAAADNAAVYQMITETYVVKYFYNYNILLQLFMKA